MDAHTLDDMWKIFADLSNMNTQEISPKDRAELEYTFKCGTITMLRAVTFGFRGLTEEQANNYLHNWNQEFNQFAQAKLKAANVSRAYN